MQFLTPIDLNQNELQNPVLQNLASDPGSPVIGQLWYNTTSHRPKVRLNGSTLDLSDALTLGGNNAAFILGRANHTGTQTAATISDFNTAVRTSRLDQMAAAGADASLGGFKLTNLANGVASTDAVTLSQLQSVQNGTTWKDKVICATTANITLSGEQSIDGVTTSASRVLVKNQSTASQNGIYLSNAGSWTRATDMATGVNGASAAVFIEQGTTLADSQWTCTSNTGSAVVGTNSLAFAQIGAGSGYTAGSGITLTGNAFSIDTAYTGQSSIVTVGTIVTGVWAASTIPLNRGGSGATTAAGARTNFGAIGKYSALIGDGSATSITITQATHGLAADGTNIVSLYDTTGNQVFTNVLVAPATGNVTLTFAVAPTASQYRVVING